MAFLILHDCIFCTLHPTTLTSPNSVCLHRGQSAKTASTLAAVRPAPGAKSQERSKQGHILLPSSTWRPDENTDYINNHVTINNINICFLGSLRHHQHRALHAIWKRTGLLRLICDLLQARLPRRNAARWLMNHQQRQGHKCCITWWQKEEISRHLASVTSTNRCERERANDNSPVLMVILIQL